MIDYTVVNRECVNTEVHVDSLQRCLAGIIADLPEIAKEMQDDLAKCETVEEELDLFKQAIAVCIDGYIDGIGKGLQLAKDFLKENQKQHLKVIN